MHRADPASRHPSPHKRGHRDLPPNRGAPVSQLLQPPEPPPPAPLTPRRARVTIRPLPQRKPLLRGYRIHPLDVIAFVLGAAVLIAVFWPGAPR